MALQGVVVISTWNDFFVNHYNDLVTNCMKCITMFSSHSTMKALFFLHILNNTHCALLPTSQDAQLAFTGMKHVNFQDWNHFLTRMNHKRWRHDFQTADRNQQSAKKAMFGTCVKISNFNAQTMWFLWAQQSCLSSHNKCSGELLDCDLSDDWVVS